MAQYEIECRGCGGMVTVERERNWTRCSRCGAESQGDGYGGREWRKVKKVAPPPRGAARRAANAELSR